MAAPMDLNIPFCSEKLLEEKLRMSFQLGYEVVAVNYDDPQLLIPKKSKKKNEDSHQVKTPDQIKPSEKMLQSIKKGSKKPFKVLSRISTVLDEDTQAHKLNSDEVQQFDLIAVQPTSDKTFLQACQSLNVDIITIAVTEKFIPKIKRQTISPALERGVHFELQYSPGIRDSTYRQYLITNAQKLMFWCRGRNVIITSGCEKPIELRGPYDVANLGLLFDLNDNQAKDAVMRNCLNVLKHSEGRRVYTKSTVKVEKATDLPESETWIVEKSDISQIPEYCDPKSNNDDKIHLSDSGDSDDDEHDDKDDNGNDDSGASYADQPKAKKIKLVSS